MKDWPEGPRYVVFEGSKTSSVHDRAYAWRNVRDYTGVRRWMAGPYARELNRQDRLEDALACATD